jgi:hypothetical protein
MSNDEGIREDELTRRQLFVIRTLSLIRRSSFGLVIDLAHAPDWLPGEGLCEIQPVDARLLSVGPPPALAARDSGLNYSREQRGQRPTQEKQELKAVS